jgi:hypothetical protein
VEEPHNTPERRANRSHLSPFPSLTASQKKTSRSHFRGRKQELTFPRRKVTSSRPYSINADGKSCSQSLKRLTSHLHIKFPTSRACSWRKSKREGPIPVPFVPDRHQHADFFLPRPTTSLLCVTPWSMYLLGPSLIPHPAFRGN